MKRIWEDEDMGRRGRWGEEDRSGEGRGRNEEDMGK